MRTRVSTMGPGPTTPMVKKLIIVNVAVFFLQLFSHGFLDIPLELWLGLIPELVVEHGFVWQVFTYQFLHSPSFLFHILINMFILWMFGIELEGVWGGKAFLRFYLTCGVFAGLSVLVFNYGSIPTVGASGAIYGILGAFAMIWPNRLLYFLGLFPIKAKYAVLVFGGLELMLGVSNVKTGIGHMAHLGGLIMGLSYVALSDPRKPLLQPLWRWLGKRKTRQKQQEWEQRKKKQQDMIDEVNRILDKLNTMTWDELPEEERRKIQRYSDELKDRDDFDDIFNL